MTFATSSPGASSAAGNPQSSTPPICQNCTTSTTPLWRRDEAGSVLCNACGLFLKLHGKPRPISLKTDVIKSRNRVKNSGSKSKKSATSGSYDGAHTPTARSEAGTPPPMMGRSRQGTPSLPPLMYDPLMQDHPTLPPLNPTSAGSGPPSPPPTVDGLIARNNQLKTRVAELELVNDLFRGRVSELESSEANARRSEIARREVEAQLRVALESASKRESALKRRVEELERRVEPDTRERKKVKVSDLTQ